MPSVSPRVLPHWPVSSLKAGLPLFTSVVLAQCLAHSECSINTYFSFASLHSITVFWKSPNPNWLSIARRLGTALETERPGLPWQLCAGSEIPPGCAATLGLSLLLCKNGDERLPQMLINVGVHFTVLAQRKHFRNDRLPTCITTDSGRAGILQN